MLSFFKNYRKYPYFYNPNNYNPNYYEYRPNKFTHKLHPNKNNNEPNIEELNNFTTSGYSPSSFSPPIYSHCKMEEMDRNPNMDPNEFPPNNFNSQHFSPSNYNVYSPSNFSPKCSPKSFKGPAFVDFDDSPQMESPTHNGFYGNPHPLKSIFQNPQPPFNFPQPNKQSPELCRKNQPNNAQHNMQHNNIQPRPNNFLYNNILHKNNHKSHKLHRSVRRSSLHRNPLRHLFHNRKSHFNSRAHHFNNYYYIPQNYNLYPNSPKNVLPPYPFPGTEEQFDNYEGNSINHNHPGGGGGTGHNPWSRTMGQTLSEPVTQKETSRCEDSRLRVGASCMQGWRVNMEDAHTTILSLPDDPRTAFFAVYDGHGG